MVQPTMIEGRWLLAEDENAIVISQDVLANEPDLKVGDKVVLEIDGKESAWVVVGIAQVLSGPPGAAPAYVNYPYYAQLTGSVGRASSVQIKSELAGHLRYGGDGDDSGRRAGRCGYADRDRLHHRPAASHHGWVL